jgi:hypothetical protein
MGMCGPYQGGRASAFDVFSIDVLADPAN